MCVCGCVWKNKRPEGKEGSRLKPMSVWSVSSSWDALRLLSKDEKGRWKCWKPARINVVTFWLRMERMALSTSAEFSMSTVQTWGRPMYTSAYGCWEVSCRRQSVNKRRGRGKTFLCYASSCRGQTAQWASSHLSQGGFALEEVRVLAALRRVEFGVEEGTAIGNGLQGGGTLVGEGQTHKQLRRREDPHRSVSTQRTLKTFNAFSPPFIVFKRLSYTTLMCFHTHTLRAEGREEACVK